MTARRILFSFALFASVSAAGLGQAQTLLSPGPGSDALPRGAMPGPLAEEEDFDRFDGPPPMRQVMPAESLAAPRGPVMSPDDPRYGRPMGAPQMASPQVANPQMPAPAYASRPAGGFIYPDANQPPTGAPPAYRQAEPAPQGDGIARPPGEVGANGVPEGQPSPTTGKSVAMLPPEDQPETGAPKELPANLKRQEVEFATKEPAGTIVVDTANTYLYYVLGNGRAIRYGIRVGRDGFRWAGTEKVTRKVEWPDWHPPAEMIERQPYLPRFMAGGDGNPLGARAMYLGNTVYRIHGTNQPSTIGKTVSSGCFGLLNEDVTDLYERVKVGARVVVLEGKKENIAASTPVAATPAMSPTNGAGAPVSLAAPNPVGPGPGGNGITSAPLPPPTIR